MELTCIAITPEKEKQFNKKGIHSVEELLQFIPRTYNDFRTETGILPSDCISRIMVKCLNVKYHNSGNAPIIIVKCIYNNSFINVSFFNQGYMYKTLSAMEKNMVFLCAQLTYNQEYNNYSASNPLVFSDAPDAKRIYPVYSAIPGMSDDYLKTKIKDAIDICTLEDIYPDDFLSETKILSLKTALSYLHGAEDPDKIKLGKTRLIFDDLFYFALKLEKNSRNIPKGSIYSIKNLKAFYSVLDSLPYQLTDDQDKTVKGMLDIIKQGKRLDALVQGDVSCGKSIVCFLMAIAMASNGYQAAIMAPTQVLARQHYNDLVSLCEPVGISVVYYAGSDMKASEKKKILASIESGAAQIIVGTHSLISPKVNYHNLALTVTDEEHKFGVLQRNALVEKAEKGVHTITMSATPIPRTLAQIIYGTQTELFTIQSMPNGRKRVRTAVTDKLDSTLNFVLKQLKEGHQAYVVCPMIDKNDKMDGVKSVEEVSRLYEDFFIQYGYKVAALTGKNSKTETESIISDFKDNNVQILVATTVIEVGVNVPNATAIIIHNAERFGLSGLHQLRGRVGRGQAQSFCVLFSEDNIDAESAAFNPRLNAMMSTNNGFEIAEIDLKLRGTGEFIGTKQSGNDKYINLMLSYKKWYKCIKELACVCLDKGTGDEYILRYEKMYCDDEQE